MAPETTRARNPMELLRTRLHITDIDESLAFFRDLLGLVEIGRRELDAGHARLILLATPEQAGRARDNDAPLLELFWQGEAGESDGCPGAGQVTYQVEDLYWLCHFLMHRGVTIERPPRDGRMARVRSPDGHLIELRQQGNPREPMEPWMGMADAEPGEPGSAAQEEAAIC